MNYNPSLKTKTKPSELHRTIRELGRLLQRSQVLLRQADVVVTASDRDAWRSAQALWKGKIKEDPVAYQRRVRSEE